MGRAVLAAGILALASCGLEIVPDLDPPGIPTLLASPGTPVFQVVYVATAVPEFRGFEVYYKFYSSDQAQEDGLTSFGELTAAGFHRMCSPGTLSEQKIPFQPLIPVNPADRGAGFLTELKFLLPTTPYLDYQASVPPLYSVLHRSAIDSLFQTKTFDQVSLDQTDSDLVGVNWALVNPGGQLTLVVYALSYGLYDLNQSLYSSARYLGYMQYYF